MKTLIASPFEDDAAEILEWGYGDAALAMFMAKIESGQRAGQAFMNTLYQFDFAGYHRLASSLVDPFYDDKRLDKAIDKLTSK